MAKYSGFEAKCQGFSHIESDTPCQDAVKVKYNNTDVFAICAAGDGHGSEKYFRSGEGSQTAVNKAVEAVEKFIKAQKASRKMAKKLANLPKSKPLDNYSEPLSEKNAKKILGNLAGYIVSEWLDGVVGHWKANSCDEREKALFEKHFPNQSMEDEKPVPKIYGTTLIVGAMTEDFAFIIQCGDGAACVIPQEGDALIPPETVDENQVGGLANSISSSNCLELFRYYYTETPPKAMVLVSDGVLESYGGNDGKDFLRFCEKVVELYMEDAKQAQGFLKDWLPKLSERGNEDDMSVTGIFVQSKKAEKTDASDTVETGTIPEMEAREGSIDEGSNQAGVADN